MSKTFDFNAISLNTLETRLDAATVLHVTTPPEYMIEQLEAAPGELAALREGGNNAEKSRAAYGLVAKLISCNTEGVTVTAEDLLTKYKIHPVVLSMYVTAYMEYINEFHTAKN